MVKVRRVCGVHPESLGSLPAAPCCTLTPVPGLSALRIRKSNTLSPPPVPKNEGDLGRCDGDFLGTLEPPFRKRWPGQSKELPMARLLPQGRSRLWLPDHPSECRRKRGQASEFHINTGT